MAKLKITLIKSTNKAQDFQTRTVQALGLRKIGQTVEHEDNPAIRGMVARIPHMVKCEEV